jgi:quinol monooxygenase YgiN
MYVITVEFEIADEHAESFRKAVDENAALSLANEPECHQFDVCIDSTSRSKFFLYERYTDRCAFDHHLSSSHFRRFNTLVEPWVVSKQVRVFERSFPTP